MKNFIVFLLIFLFPLHLLFAQEDRINDYQISRIKGKVVIRPPGKKNKTLDIHWVSPTTNLTVGQPKVDIQVKALSSHDIDEGHFTVYLNGEVVQTKFGNVSLKGMKKQRTYLNTLHLEEGTNEIYVEVYNQAGKRSTNPLVINYNTPKELAIDWLPAQKIAKALETGVLELTTQTISTDKVNTQHFKIYQNGKLLPPTGKEKVRKRGKNTYHYTNKIQLLPNENDLVVRVESGNLVQNTTPLTLTYTPEHLAANWVFPKRQSIKIKQAELPIQIEVQTSEPLKTNHLQLFIDGKPIKVLPKDIDLQTGLDNTYLLATNLSIPAGEHKIVAQLANKVGRKQLDAINVIYRPSVLNLAWKNLDVSEEIITDKPSIDIELRVESSDDLEKLNFTTFLNDTPMPRNNVSLTNDGRGNYHFFQNIPLFEENRKHEIVIEVKSEVGTQTTQPLLVTYTPKRLDVFWIDPNPDLIDPRGLVAEGSSLPINLKVLSSRPLTQDNFYIYINKQLYNSTQKPRLRGQNGEYIYSNVIQLQETTENVNNIVVQVHNAAGTEKTKKLPVIFSPAKPNLHILAIGTNPVDLEFTEKDARDFAKLFDYQEGIDALFGRVNVETLLGSEASSRNIEGTLEEYIFKFNQNNIGAKDLLVVFISSHGFMYEDEFRIQGNDYDPIRKISTSVGYADLMRSLKYIKCKKLMFLDACNSGGAGLLAMGGKSSAGNTIAENEAINKAIQKLNKEQNGMTTIASSSDKQYSYEDAVWQNGAFTQAIQDGLQDGKSDKNKDGIITINEMFNYLRKSVPKMVKQVKNQPQQPAMTTSDLGNLPIYLIRQ